MVTRSITSSTTGLYRVEMAALLNIDSFVNATCGAAGGFFSSVVLFPLDVVKTVLQATEGKSATFMDVAKDIVAKDGIMGLWQMSSYRGCSSANEKMGYFYIYSFLVDAWKKQFDVKTLGTIPQLTVRLLCVGRGGL